ncbi:MULTISPECIES: hypothetical protein [unclassified Acidovorax]|uniref:hypothetical protein n=1 Tax=unclassified Acidovorax TaxID=2684926 RepID=UPI0028830BD7|nr:MULTISPECIES: hypothetical protein [unclassified Acidovorax]
MLRIRPARRTLPLARTCAVAAATVWALTGCVAPPQDVPAPAVHALSTQKTARAAHHWDVLATDVAAQVADRLREWPAGEHPIHVALSPDDSGFGRGFKQLVVTRLVERGLAVSTDAGPLQLQIATQLVQHHAGAAPTSNGPWVADGVRTDRSPVVPTPDIAAGALRTEVLVTTSLEREQRILVRTSDVVSIAQDDAALYQARVIQPAAAPVPIMRTWRVVP